MSARQAEVLWLTAPGELELRMEELRAPAHSELLCETLFTTISPGTELAAYKGLPPLRPGVQYPRLLGYCNVARVLEAGPAAKGFSPGDLVLSFTSHRSAFIIEAKDVLYRLLEGSVPQEIACAYLFHLGYNAVLRANVRAGSRVLVIGLGVLGLTTVAMASMAGAQVFALSDHEHLAYVAMKFGAQGVFSRNDLEAMTARLGPGLADVVVSTTNSWPDWQTALRCAGMQATIGVLGFPGRGVAPPSVNPLDSQHFYVKQLRIEAVGMSPKQPDGRGFCRFNERDNIDFVATQINQGRLNASLLVSGCYGRADARQAYRDLLGRRSSVITYQIKWTDI